MLRSLGVPRQIRNTNTAGKHVYVKVALQVHGWMEMIIGMDTLNKVARSREIVQRNMDHWWPKFQPMWSFSAKQRKERT